MRSSPNSAGLGQLSALFSEGITGASTDGQLLEQFATRRGDASQRAFTALVERHGPVVMRLCRSVLRDEHEAQDAFQATFLVLAQKAESLWVRDSLGPWLHSVAYRVASCARAVAIRRRRHEHEHGAWAGARLAVYRDEHREDLEAVVHEEIDHLPEPFRAPVVLCDLEGCTHEQAARHLGVPVGTVKSRQARGRRRLRARLIRRGLSPSAGLLFEALPGPGPTVPASLTKSTANLATCWAGADSARVAVLARGVLKVMFLNQLKVMVLSISMIAMAGAGAGLLAWRSMAAGPGQEPANPAPATPRPKPAPAVAKQERAGKIYFAAVRPDPRGSGVINTLMAFDPQTLARMNIFDGCAIRPRVSPGGKWVAYQTGGAVWVRGVEPNAEARSIAKLGDSESGSPPVWSPDGKQIVISMGRGEGGRWIFTTWRIQVDGSGAEKLPVPPEDSVHDWSPDGRWLVTVSQRGAKIGWQLDIMHPDGTERRRITDGGNPFGARFSPDGRRVLYADGARGEQSGVWTVDVDGKNGRLVCPIDRSKMNASPCWSPDGQRIAMTLTESWPGAATFPKPVRIVVMDLDGGHRSEILIPDAGPTDMPDWR